MEQRSQRLHRRKDQKPGTAEDAQRDRTQSRKKTREKRLSNPYPGGPRTPRLVLDSNVLTKLAIEEANSKEARTAVQSFLKKGYTLHTVDIALAEALNAVWKHTKIHKDLPVKEAEQAARDLIKIHDKLNMVTTRELAEQTASTALAQNMTIYDALYIAAAQKLGATLYTADQELYASAGKTTSAKLLKP